MQATGCFLPCLASLWALRGASSPSQSAHDWADLCSAAKVSSCIYITCVSRAPSSSIASWRRSSSGPLAKLCRSRSSACRLRRDLKASTTVVPSPSSTFRDVSSCWPNAPAASPVHHPRHVYRLPIFPSRLLKATRLAAAITEQVVIVRASGAMPAPVKAYGL